MKISRLRKLSAPLSISRSCWFHLMLASPHVVYRIEGSGIKRRELGVYFKNLRVTGIGATASHQATVGSMFNPKAIWKECRSALRPSTRTILHDFNGVVKPGEMLREFLRRCCASQHYAHTHSSQLCWVVRDPDAQHSSRCSQINVTPTTM